ncbi:MAG: alkaline phosphatase [Proteobacteria bacterium]|nr:alkaline phosphatase [Pseudomonadota bacterium]
MDQMALRSAVQVLTVSESVPGLPVYVADSANSATAMATGQVTSRGRIATTAGSDQDLPTILELAHAQGLRTGVVTTSSITDATSSSFMAHVSLRGCENPTEMVNDELDAEARAEEVSDCRADLKSNGGLNLGADCRRLSRGGPGWRPRTL